MLNTLKTKVDVDAIPACCRALQIGIITTYAIVRYIEAGCILLNVKVFSRSEIQQVSSYQGNSCTFKETVS